MNFVDSRYRIDGGCRTAGIGPAYSGLHLQRPGLDVVVRACSDFFLHHAVRGCRRTGVHLVPLTGIDRVVEQLDTLFSLKVAGRLQFDRECGNAAQRRRCFYLDPETGAALDPALGRS